MSHPLPLLVGGSIAIDNVKTPSDEATNLLGGSASYASLAATYFTKPVHLVGVIGNDYPPEHLAMLERHGVTLGGVERSEGASFSWSGEYHQNMNDRTTHNVAVNVLESWEVNLPVAVAASPVVVLANMAPKNQLEMLDQCVGEDRFVLADTMDLWINIQKEELLQLIRRIDGLVLNDSEAKLLTGEENLVKAGQAVLDLGAKFCVLKKGEHGAMYFGEDGCYVLPAYPTEDVLDPTGAGDSFAGGMMGYLASQDATDPASIKRALVYGTLVASYNVEDFSLDRMQQIERDSLDQRFAQYQQMLSID